MKKLVLIAALMLLALGAYVLPAAAQEDVSALAGYFSADTLVYASFRTDDAFIDTMDALVAKIGSALPGGMMPGSLKEVLDQAATMFTPGGTFASTIRPWLGDSAAIGVNSFAPQTAQNPKPPVTIAIAITDQDKAEAFFEILLTAERYALSEGDGYTLYSPKNTGSSDPYVVFRSDVILITSDENLAAAGGVPDAPLSEKDAFSTALGLLPADQYNAVAYIDTPALFGLVMPTAMAMSRSASSASPMNGMFTSLLSVLKPQAIGVTLLNDRSLVLDVASPLDPTAAQGFNLMANRGVIDPAFAQHIPAGTALVAHGTNLYGSYQAGLDNLHSMIESFGDSEAAQKLNVGLWALEFGVRGLTGLEVDDAAGWMTGDYAMYLGFTPAFSDSQDVFSAMTRMPVDFGITIAAADPAAAQAVYDGLTRSLGNLPVKEIAVTHETLDGGVDALVFTITADNIPFPIELLVATGNGVFAMGTRRMVTAAINPQNGLDTDPSFMEAGATLLENPSQVFYLAGSGLQPLATVLMGKNNPARLQTQGAQLKAIFDLISSATLSTSALPDSSGSVTRFAWTLPQ